MLTHKRLAEIIEVRILIPPCLVLRLGLSGRLIRGFQRQRSSVRYAEAPCTKNLCTDVAGGIMFPHKHPECEPVCVQSSGLSVMTTKSPSESLGVTGLPQVHLTLLASSCFKLLQNVLGFYSSSLQTFWFFSSPKTNTVV